MNEQYRIFDGFEVSYHGKVIDWTYFKDHAEASFKQARAAKIYKHSGTGTKKLIKEKQSMVPFKDLIKGHVSFAS